MITHHRSTVEFPAGSTFVAGLATFGPFNDGRTYHEGVLKLFDGGSVDASVTHYADGTKEFRWSVWDGQPDGLACRINHDTEASA